MRALMAGIAFDLVAQPFIIIAGKMQVMHTNFRGDSFFFQRQHIGKQLQFFFCADMQDMQPGIIFFGDLDGIER